MDEPVHRISYATGNENGCGLWAGSDFLRYPDDVEIISCYGIWRKTVDRGFRYWSFRGHDTLEKRGFDIERISCKNPKSNTGGLPTIYANKGQLNLNRFKFFCRPALRATDRLSMGPIDSVVYASWWPYCTRLVNTV